MAHRTKPAELNLDRYSWQVDAAHPHHMVLAVKPDVNPWREAESKRVLLQFTKKCEEKDIRTKPVRVKAAMADGSSLNVPGVEFYLPNRELRREFKHIAGFSQVVWEEMARNLAWPLDPSGYKPDDYTFRVTGANYECVAVVAKRDANISPQRAFEILRDKLLEMKGSGVKLAGYIKDGGGLVPAKSLLSPVVAHREHYTGVVFEVVSPRAQKYFSEMMGGNYRELKMRLQLADAEALAEESAAPFLVRDLDYRESNYEFKSNARVKNAIEVMVRAGLDSDAEAKAYAALDRARSRIVDQGERHGLKVTEKTGALDLRTPALEETSGFSGGVRRGFSFYLPNKQCLDIFETALAVKLAEKDIHLHSSHNASRV